MHNFVAALSLRAGFLSALAIQVQVLERRLQPAAVIPNPVRCESPDDQHVA